MCGGGCAYSFLFLHTHTHTLPCQPPSPSPRGQFEEDLIYRHLEPALAFQLEINRLSNFDVQLISTQNMKMHMYYATAKVGVASGGRGLGTYVHMNSWRRDIGEHWGKV